MDTRFTDLLAPFLKFLDDDAGAIAPDTLLRPLGLDSMQAIELLFAIEDEFGVTVPDEAMTDETFASAGSLWKVVCAARAEQTPADETAPRAA